MIEMLSTIMSGAQAVKGPRGLMTEIVWRTAMTKKKMFASLLN